MSWKYPALEKFLEGSSFSCNRYGDELSAHMLVSD